MVYLTTTEGGMWEWQRLEMRMQSANGKIDNLYGVLGYGRSGKSFDLASQHPAIFFRELLELTCSSRKMGG